MTMIMIVMMMMMMMMITYGNGLSLLLNNSNQKVIGSALSGVLGFFLRAACVTD